jgi:hypothetical protein
MAWHVLLQVIAVSCQGAASSSPASKDIKIVEAPAVVVTMTLGGSLTAEQVTPEVEQQLENAVAESLGISSALIEIQSVKNARRRLLALAVTFRILAANAVDAAVLQKKATTTDFTSAIKKQTGLNIQVSGISADVVSGPASLPTVSQTPSGNGSGGSNVVTIAAAVGGAGGGLLILGAILLFVYMRKSGRWQRYNSTTTDKVEEFASVSAFMGDDQAEQVRHHTGLFVYALYIYIYVCIYIYIYIYSTHIGILSV